MGVDTDTNPTRYAVFALSSELSTIWHQIMLNMLRVPSFADLSIFLPVCFIGPQQSGSEAFWIISILLLSINIEDYSNDSNKTQNLFNILQLLANLSNNLLKNSTAPFTSLSSGCLLRFRCKKDHMC